MSHFEGQNLWLLKPTFLNRGRGVSVFKDIESLTKMLFEEKMPADGEENIYKDMWTFVIQKYIEKPLLVNDRKFDIRVWVLINQNMDCYF